MEMCRVCGRTITHKKDILLCDDCIEEFNEGEK